MNRILLLLLLGASTIAFSQIQTSSSYVCPPCGNDCDKIEHSKPGVCEHCNMVLIKKNQVKTIAFYLQDGVEVLDFAGPMEVFAYAGYKVFTVSKTSEPIKSQGILTVVPDYAIDNAPNADILAFFGGNSRRAVHDKKVIRWIEEQEDIQLHFSVCTGAFLLAEAGILDGKVATTFHDALDGLANSYPKVDVRREVRFVDNGEVITTAGISAGIDGALHLVAKLQGLNAAKRTAYYMEYDNWVPGNGLILSPDNPYTKEPIELSPFLGHYEHFQQEEDFEVFMKNGELAAKSGQTTYPIYHESRDIFSTVQSDPIYFERDEDGKVRGYRVEPNGTLYRKTK